jgi:hypothetical protein
MISDIMRILVRGRGTVNRVEATVMRHDYDYARAMV